MMPSGLYLYEIRAEEFQQVKRMMLLKYFLAIIILSNLFSCRTPNENNNQTEKQEVNFTLDGGDFNEDFFSISLPSARYSETFITFDSDTLRFMLIGTVEITPGFRLSFPGEKRGTYTWLEPSSQSGVQIIISYYPYTSLSPIEGETIVNSAGDVGEYLKGSFSGLLHNPFSNSESPKDTIKIDGDFSVLRGNDIEYIFKADGVSALFF